MRLVSGPPAFIPGMTSNRVPPGVPTGGQFAPKTRREPAVRLVHCEGQMTIEDCIEVVEREQQDAKARAMARAAEEAADRKASYRLRELVDEDDFEAAAKVLPNLRDDEVRNRLRDIADALRTAVKYEENPADAAEEAPDAEQLVDIADFGGWGQDRIGEGDSHGYDFDAYGRALGEAWRQHAQDAAVDAVKANRQAGAAAS